MVDVVDVALAVAQIYQRRNDCEDVFAAQCADRVFGIKLLDIVNPTDWREFTQNTMEDSRVPVWMAKAEMDIGETGNLQFLT